MSKSMTLAGLTISQCCLSVLMLGICEVSSAEEKDHVILGAGAAVLPRYQGAETYKAEPVPLIDVKKGRFFARTSDGIGFNIIETPQYTLGASVTWMRGYDEKDVPDGIGKLSSALGGRVFASTRLMGAVGTLSVTQSTLR